MPVEIQLTEDNYFACDSSQVRIGQRMTISSRTITSLSFKLDKQAGATGNITFAIRKHSADTVLASKVWGDASTLPLHNGGGGNDSVWCTAIFDTPVNINEEVKLCCEFSTNSIYPRATTPSVKAGERLWFYTGGTWNDGGATDADVTYYYVYTTTSALSVSTLAMSSVSGTTATGNGRIAVFGSDGSCTQHGHCWDTSANPTTALATKTTLGAKSTLGLFTSSLTTLIPGTTYHVRAYATDSVSTYYGEDITFVGAEEVATYNPLRGDIAVVGEYVVYGARSGKRRKLLGDEY